MSQIFVVIYNSGGLKAITTDENEAKRLAQEVDGMFGELINVQDFRPTVEEVFGKKVADSIDNPGSLVSRELPLYKSSWTPARPGDTPGQLVPEGQPTQPIDVKEQSKRKGRFVKPIGRDTVALDSFPAPGFDEEEQPKRKEKLDNGDWCGNPNCNCES